MHACNPSTWEGRGRQISEFEASLAYKVSSRTARAIQRNPASKKTKSKKQKQKPNKQKIFQLDKLGLNWWLTVQVSGAYGEFLAGASTQLTVESARGTWGVGTEAAKRLESEFYGPGL